MYRFGGDVWAADKLLIKEADAGQLTNEEAALRIRGSVEDNYKLDRDCVRLAPMSME